MPTFYAGQEDYIDQLNALADSAGGSVYHPLTVTMVGAPVVPIKVQRSPTVVFDNLDGTVIAPTIGYTASSISYLENINLPSMSDLSSLVFNDMNCCVGNISLSTIPSLVTLGFPALQVFGINTLSISSLAALTSLDFSALTTLIGNLVLSGLSSLTTLNFPVLNFGGSGISFNSSPALTTLGLPALAKGSTIGFNDLGISSLSLPSLTALRGVLSTGGNNPSLTSISAPNLVVAAGGITLLGVPALSSLTLTSLSKTGQFSLTTNSAITTISLPAITIIGSTVTTVLSIVNATALSNFTLGSGLKQMAGNVAITGCALNQASVDGVLARLAALDGTAGTTVFGTGRTVNLTGGTTSTPSAAGLASKATLQARGVTVTNN